MRLILDSQHVYCFLFIILSFLLPSGTETVIVKNPKAYKPLTTLPSLFLNVIPQVISTTLKLNVIFVQILVSLIKHNPPKRSPLLRGALELPAILGSTRRDNNINSSSHFSADLPMQYNAQHLGKLCQRNWAALRKVWRHLVYSVVSIPGTGPAGTRTIALAKNVKFFRFGGFDFQICFLRWQLNHKGIVKTEIYEFCSQLWVDILEECPLYLSFQIQSVIWKDYLACTVNNHLIKQATYSCPSSFFTPRTQPSIMNFMRRNTIATYNKRTKVMNRFCSSLSFWQNKQISNLLLVFRDKRSETQTFSQE